MGVAMRLLGNILWFILAGLPLFLGYFVAGALMCATIVGIPFGVQAFKLALFTAWPFGRVVVALPGDSGCISVVFNILWLIFAGIWLALWHLFAGLLLCLTIIGIPFGLASFRMAALALTPFGKTVMTVEELRGLRTPHTVFLGALEAPRAR
jgi:uncharacterized membrane protein YccF (DUF307 family)